MNTLARIKIKPRADPLYQKLFDDLKERILRGDFANGHYLPSESELEAKFKVSRITVVRALKELTLAGLVVREKGRGTRVRTATEGTLIRGPSGRRSRETTTASGHFLTTKSARAQPDRQVKVVEFSRVRAPVEVAKSLKLRSGVNVLRIVRILSFEDVPYAHTTAFLSAALGSGWSAADLERQTLASLLARIGIAIDQTEEEVTAVAASAAVGLLLKIDAGTPLIKVTRTTFSKGRQPIEHVVTLHPPERFRYAISTSHRLRETTVRRNGD